MKKKKLISVVTPCYNEEENVADAYNAVKSILSKFPQYQYEHIFIDNASNDKTVDILKRLAKKDKKLKIIVNIKNFGHIKSPYYALLQVNGDAIVTYTCDLQDPAELIKDFIKNWEKGHKVVVGVKNKSKENPIMFLFRKIYYKIIDMISESEQIKNFMGFGLYDKSFINILKKIETPYPYFRGLVAEYSSNRLEVPYIQQKRKKGKTKNNFYTLYDNAMLGFVNHSKIPLRLASFIGFGTAVLSLIMAMIYLIYKLIHWENFQLGIAPAVIGLSFFSSIQLFFIGIVGEYIGAIYTHVKNKPLVIEKERINFTKK